MIFVDTWAWVALALTKDQYHRIAITAHRRFLRKRYVTTNFVLSELIAHL
jgi:predicted nucleic acid-binding protein